MNSSARTINMGNEITLQTVQDTAARCDLCELHTNRIKPVFARGNPKSDFMICGMCPGPDENVQGSPFVGTAGQVLNELLMKTFGGTESVYITNLVKCFVKPGIPLQQSWMNTCLPYFVVQVSLIKPKVIVLLGKDVCNYFLGSDVEMGKLRGKTFKYLNTNVVCTYHPSYLARGGGIKHKHFNTVLKDFSTAYLLSNQ
jgi:uracil-DNA glycosylase family 4